MKSIVEIAHPLGYKVIAEGTNLATVGTFLKH